MVSVDLYAVDPGERIVRIQAAYAGREPGTALDRAAMGAVRALAEREGIARGPRTMLLDATASSVALGHLIEGQERFWQGNFDAAVKDYDKVLEQYPGGPKAPSAQLKKGYALLELGQKEAGVRELNSLIARFPRSAEAAQARNNLAAESESLASQIADSVLGRRVA